MARFHFHNNNHPVFRAKASERKGKPVKESIYWYWWQALRRSEKYKIACAKNGTGMKKLFDDFGDIHAFPNRVEGFEKWWRQKREAYGDKDNNLGAYLFGEPPLSYDVQLLTAKDVQQLANGWDQKQQALLSIPLQLPKDEIKRRLKRVLANIPNRKDTDAKKWKGQSHALYKVAEGYRYTASEEKKGPLWTIQRAFEFYDELAKDPKQTKWKLAWELDEANDVLSWGATEPNYMVYASRRKKLAEDLIEGAEQGIFPHGLRKHGR